MKKYLLGMFAMVLAIFFSSFGNFAPLLAVEAPHLNNANVSNSASYAPDSHQHYCPGGESPCLLDLGLIPASFGVTDRTSFLSYLNSQFSTPAARLAEVNRIAIEFWN